MIPYAIDIQDTNIYTENPDGTYTVEDGEPDPIDVFDPEMNILIVLAMVMVVEQQQQQLTQQHREQIRMNTLIYIGLPRHLVGFATLYIMPTEQVQILM